MAAGKVVIVTHAGTAYPINAVSPGIIDTINHSRFKFADDSLKDTSAPIPIPVLVASKNYSFRKYFKLRFTSSPPSQITNLRWFTDASNPLLVGVTGVNVLVGATATYTAPSVGADNADLTTSLAGGGNCTTRTSASPMVLVGTGSVTGVLNPVVNTSTVYPSTGSQPFIVQQMEIQSTATSGPTPDLTYNFRYDEE